MSELSFDSPLLKYKIKYAFWAHFWNKRITGVVTTAVTG